MPWRAGHSNSSELYEVWRNGVREPLAVLADVELGFIDRYRTDAAGQILYDVLRPDRPLTERLYGEIELRKCNKCRW